jgi:hypothetical protein
VCFKLRTDFHAKVLRAKLLRGTDNWLRYDFRSKFILLSYDFRSKFILLSYDWSACYFAPVDTALCLMKFFENASDARDANDARISISLIAPFAPFASFALISY